MKALNGRLLEKIQHGYDNCLELKEVRFVGDKIRTPECEDLADELAAFANGRGGELLLGVHGETREVVGIPLDRLDDVERLVIQACEESMDPVGAPMIERLMLLDSAGVDRPIMRVGVQPGLFVHRSPGGYYSRVGASKRPIPPDQLARLFEQRSKTRLIRFDETPVPGATFSDLKDALWRRFAPSESTDAPEHLLSKLAMTSQDRAGAWRPTVAGVLLACRSPQQFLPNAFIQVVAYRGKTISPQAESAYQRDARDITGPLDRQIFEACDFVRRNMPMTARKGPAAGREDMPGFDMLAVFEAITNAVAHRDYSMAGSKVRLRLFDDRLDLYTPGPLVNTMTPESLAYRQATRNEAVTSLLARCPIERDDPNSYRTHVMDKRGEGVPLILSRSELLAGRTPEYRLVDESELLLTIFAAPVFEIG